MLNRLLYSCHRGCYIIFLSAARQHALYSAPLCLRSPLRPQLSVFTAFWAYGCLWPWLSWACSYCGLGIFVGTCERHRQNLQTCLSEALCIHSCLFSPLSVHMAVWNRGHPGAAVMELPLVVDFTMNLKKDLKHRPFTESHET